jgi:hypothetical protein
MNFLNVIKKTTSLSRFIGYMKWRAKMTLNSRRFTQFDGDAYKIYWISPDRINDVLAFSGEPSPILERGVVRDGDWDLKTIPWETLDAWIAFKYRFEKGGQWSETLWYKKVLKKIKDRGDYYDCSNKEELDNRFKKIDELFYQIKQNGYKTQIARKQSVLPSVEHEDEIHVHIDRNGKYLFGDGRHRLCIAKFLKLEKVPVKVARRHKQWALFRNEIFDYVQRGDGRTYQPLTHPDLADIPSTHTAERFDIINKNLPVLSGTLLDIGSNWGYFSNRFEKAGFTCTAVESYPKELYFLKKLRLAEGCSFEIIPRSILELKGDLKYDVVLALNIFHHFLKTKDTYYLFLDLLNRIKTKVMFFEPHCPQENQMEKSFKNYEPLQFAQLIASNCDLNSYKLIGRVENGRNIYMLKK